MKEDQLQEGGGHSLFTLKNIILLLLGFILGYMIKEQAVQNITMGHDDYKIIVNKEKLNNVNKAGTETDAKDITGAQTIDSTDNNVSNNNNAKK